MATPLEDFLPRLPEAEREDIDRAMTKAVEEEATLRRLREARRQSQAESAVRLKTTQAGVSRIEKRADAYVSTLRRYVEAMGGKLSITAEFPDGPPVRVEQFGD